MQQHGLINKQQHEFLTKKSTSTNLVLSLNDWTLAVNNVSVAFIDYKKAFDAVCHSKLSQAARQGLAVLMASVVVIYFYSSTANTSEPIFAHNSSKKAFWCEEDPFGDEKCVVVKFGGVLL